MWHSYVLGKSMHRYRRSASKLRFFLAAAIVFILIIAAAAIVYDLSHSNSNKPIDSKTQVESVTGNLQTFYSGYFRFQDTGKWVLKQNESSENKYIYYKFHGLQIDDQLIVYVNQVPIPLYLATSRVLPVRIVNNDSFDATTISGPCGATYGPAELHKIKTLTINGAAMLCDPDTPLYTVVLAEVGGNYQLNMHRRSGSPVQFVITFRDLRTEPNPNTLLQIANSFQTL